MSSEQPDVTIVIAVRNAAAELDETLRSVGSQTAWGSGRVEVVVIDGASTDGTVAIATASGIPRFVVSEPDDGIYDAMNTGAARAHGTWLHFLNAGDRFASATSLVQVLEGLERSAAAGREWFVAGAVYTGGRVDGQVIPSVPHRWWAHAYGLQPHCHQATWVRRDVFAALGGYSLQHSFADDFDLILRLGRRGRPGEDPRVVIAYLAGGLSAQRAAEVPQLLRAVRRDRLGLTGARRRADDAAVQTVACLTRVRRAWWWTRAAVLYVPKRVVRARAAA